MRVLALRYIDGSIVIYLKTETNCIGVGVVPQESANLQSPKSFLTPQRVQAQRSLPELLRCSAGRGTCWEFSEQ